MTPHPAPPARRPGEAAFQRPVSPSEWLYLGAHRLGHAMVLHLVVEGDGTLDAGTLRTAVAAAAEACPGSRLMRRGRVWIDSGRAPLVRTAPSGSGPDAELRSGTDWLEEPLDLRHGPGCEVLLFPRTGGGTSVVFRAFHGVMDGHGARIWAGEVFRALRGEPPRPARSALTDAQVLAEAAATGHRPALRLDQPSPLSGRTAGATADGGGRALWRRRVLPGRAVSATARLARAVADATGAPRSRIMVPVDVRRHLGAASATGNLALPVFLDLAEEGSWQDARSDLLQALAERRELSSGFESALARLPLPAVAALLRAGRGAALRRDRHMASAVVSHLGRIDPAEYSGGGFTARTLYALPVHAPLVPLSCAVVELPDRTELTVGFQGGAGLATRAEALMDLLAAAVAEPGPPAATAAAAGRRQGPPASVSVPVPPVPGSGERAAETVVDVLRRRAALTPHAVALDGPAGPVDYASLDGRSDAVAAELLRRGIGREDTVGLLVDRSPAGVAGMWGILKAGAAYLPLDPGHPDVRIAELLRGAGAVACLTERRLLERVRRVAPCPGRAVEDVPRARPGAVLPDLDPRQLAYVVHTSGSTGRPKGVQVEHRALLAFARWADDLCRTDDRSRFAFLSSFAFDISCFPLFVPPLRGGTAVLLPGEPTSRALRELLEDHRADTLAVTPSHLELIGRYGLGLSGLRTLLAGGEQFTLAAAERVRRQTGPATRIINAYGPTEATVGCLAHVLDGTETGPTVPIGLASPTIGVELGDGSGEPVESDRPGTVGEILLSGVQLARGYLGRPDLDAVCFPVGADGVRRYRTGDLGRRLPGGELEFLGRRDDQLKIAGHRVEPAEVRAALESHPSVLTAAVTVRERPGGGQALCAYAVITDGGTAASDAGTVLRAHLAGRLPAHLVPAAVLPVADLPRTVGGKTDFDALPDPFARPAAPVPAGTGTGEDVVTAVIALWSRVLGADPRAIGTDSDFQELGGDSLAVLEMLSAVADELLGPGRSDALVAALDGLLRELTPGRVGAVVRRVRAEATGGAAATPGEAEA